MRRAAVGPLARKENRTTSLDDWRNVRDPQDFSLSGEGTDLGRELRRRVLAYGLDHCLTAAQRQAVELCCGEGMTLTMAARRLGVCPSTVSRRLAAAMDKLRKLAGGGIPAGAVGP